MNRIQYVLGKGKLIGRVLFTFIAAWSRETWTATTAAGSGAGAAVGAFWVADWVGAVGAAPAAGTGAAAAGGAGAAVQTRPILSAWNICSGIFRYIKQADLFFKYLNIKNHFKFL